MNSTTITEFAELAVSLRSIFGPMFIFGLVAYITKTIADNFRLSAKLYAATTTLISLTFMVLYGIVLHQRFPDFFDPSMFSVSGFLTSLFGYHFAESDYMDWKYRTEEGVIAAWTTWERTLPDNPEKYPAVVLECRKNNIQYLVYYEADIDYFKSLPIGTTVTIPQNWHLLDAKAI